MLTQVMPEVYCVETDKLLIFLFITKQNDKMNRSALKAREATSFTEESLVVLLYLDPSEITTAKTSK